MGLGKVLLKYREAKGVSLAIASRGIGISKGYLQQIESQQKVPIIATLKQIATYYNTTLASIFEELKA